MHDLSRMPWIPFVDRNDHQVVEDALGGKMHVDDLGDGFSDEREEDALARKPKIEVFHRWNADDGRQIGGPLAARHAREMKNRIVVRLRVKARVVAKRAFAAAFAGIDVAFEDDV